MMCAYDDPLNSMRYPKRLLSRRVVSVLLSDSSFENGGFLAIYGAD